MGTSGLRKRVSLLKGNPSYLKNFVQSIFDAIPPSEVKGGTLVLGGDGRFFNREALQTIIRMAAANGVAKIWVGKGGLLSTPAVSSILRERGGGEAFGAIVLTASHNPGGPDGDFGIKFNTGDGAPALGALTDAIHRKSTEIKRYYIVDEGQDVDIDTVGDTAVVGETCEVTVIDPVEDYAATLRRCFNFDALRALLARPDFSMVFDGMHGAGGPSALAILVEELGAPEASAINCLPSEDFNGGHPDPNLVYAKELVARMGLDTAGSPTAKARASPTFGAAADGDAGER